MPAALTETIPPGTPLFRVHRTAHQPLHFDQGPDGRFNPPDHDERFGTLYLATAPAGAFLETLGRLVTIPRSDVAIRSLTTVTFRRPLRLFDVHAAGNRVHYDGIDLAGDAIATTPDYTQPRRLPARVWDDDGELDGIHYAARHDNTTVSRSVALFASPGIADRSAIVDQIVTAAIPSDLVDTVADTYGLTVLHDLPLP